MTLGLKGMLVFSVDGGLGCNHVPKAFLRLFLPGERGCMDRGRTNEKNHRNNFKFLSLFVTLARCDNYYCFSWADAGHKLTTEGERQG